GSGRRPLLAAGCSNSACSSTSKARMNRVLAVTVVAWSSVAMAAVVSDRFAVVSAKPGAQALRSDRPTELPSATAAVWGVVRDTAGSPVDGGVVSFRGIDQTITTSVFTDEHGEYVTPPLPAGRYRAWAQAVGFATERSELSLGRPTSESFTLRPIDDFSAQLTGAEWGEALPAATADDRPMTRIVRTLCSGYHSLAAGLLNRLEQQGSQ